MAGTLYITGDATADQLLNTDGTALLIGMLLDQQVPMEWAFTGPATLQKRLGHLDARAIAAMDRDEFVQLQPAGWQQAAGVFGDPTPRSVADIHSPETLAVIREWKRSAKAARRDTQDRPLP